MNIYSIVTEQNLTNLRKLTEQQKNQRAVEIENRILKQTHDKKTGRKLSPINKKFEEVNESTKKLGDLIKESSSENENTQEIVPVEIHNIQTNIKSLPNSSNFSKSMRKLLGSLLSSPNSLNITQDESGQANILSVPFQISVRDSIKIKDNIYDLTSEIYRALSSVSHTGKIMKDENEILMMYKFINDLYYTSVGNKSSKRKTYFTKTLPKLVEDIQNKTFEENADDSDNLESQGATIIVPSNIIGIYTRLEKLL